MKMTNKPHDDGCTACVRRLYLHARDGGRVSVLDMAQVVRWMERKDQEIAELQHFRRLDKLSETGTAQAFAALSDGEKLRWFVTTGQRDREQTERIKELEAENKRLTSQLGSLRSEADIARIAELEAWQAAAFEAHPNIDLDIDALAAGGKE